MPRKKLTVRPVKKMLYLDRRLVVAVDLLLYSEVEGKVPFGGWKKYIEGLIREDLKKRTEKGDGINV